MSDTAPPPLPPAWNNPTAAAADDTQWQPLPPRGARLAGLGGALATAVPFGFGFGFLALISNLASPFWVAPLAALIGAVLGAQLAVKRHRRTFWKLDEDGFALRRGRWWQVESRVPISRVQHLDLKRGPLERNARLSTLIIHTAGTKLAAVSVSGLDADDAERLRDRLARQLDDDDAL